jgi:hypothetical protein
MKYIGQTGRPFNTRFYEHFRDFKYATQKSRFAQHLLEHGHAFGPIENVMKIIHPTTKGRQQIVVYDCIIIIEFDINTTGWL